MQRFDATVSKDMLQSVPAVVDLYMLEGFDFSSHDIGSNSDPYLIISCGDMVYNERDNYQCDQSNPKFNKLYSFSVNFPGPPNIVITAYDYDTLFGDDLIGKTTIDLDDRFYSVDW
jgi:Ca2+-dependent lipid-binding protein